jgi:hypothetical protein
MTTPGHISTRAMDHMVRQRREHDALAATRYLVGLDFGQAADYTALGVLEWQGADDAARAAQPAGERRYHCRHLERLPIGTPYPAVVAHVLSLLATPALRGRATLVVDATGVGRPVVDMLRQAGLWPVAITITGGSSVGGDGNGWTVPKRDLVGTLQVLLQGERLQFAAELPMVPTLVAEMMAFRVKITDAAHDTYGAWREGAHDDLVLAVAVAAWYAEQWTAPRPPPFLRGSRSYFSI